MTRRTERVNDLLREEISSIVHRDLKDPRLGGLISITEVETSPDFRHARVFVSVMGTDEERVASLKALNSAAGFMRRELRGRLQSLRYLPELTFKLDDSIERGTRLSALINQVALENHLVMKVSSEKDKGGSPR
jgi:ribosome-binding factor A